MTETETFRPPLRPLQPSPSCRLERCLVHPAAASQSVEDMKAYTVGTVRPARRFNGLSATV